MTEFHIVRLSRGRFSIRAYGKNWFGPDGGNAIIEICRVNSARKAALIVQILAIVGENDTITDDTLAHNMRHIDRAIDELQTMRQALANIACRALDGGIIEK